MRRSSDQSGGIWSRGGPLASVPLPSQWCASSVGGERVPSRLDAAASSSVTCSARGGSPRTLVLVPSVFGIAPVAGVGPLPAAVARLPTTLVRPGIMPIVPFSGVPSGVPSMMGVPVARTLLPPLLNTAIRLLPQLRAALLCHTLVRVLFPQCGLPTCGQGAGATQVKCVRVPVGASTA